MKPKIVELADGRKLKPLRGRHNIDHGKQVPVYYLPRGERDWGGRGRSGAEQADHDERHAGPISKELRAAYYPIIGDAPSLGPGDTEGAAAYLIGIKKAISQGGWTNSEWRRLNKLHLKWHRRATGEDPYFMVYGNKRQWANHGTNTDRPEDRGVLECDRRIKEIIRSRVIEEKEKLDAKGETPEERAIRLENRGRSRVGDWDLD